MILAVRSRSDAGILDCRDALTCADGDVNGAIEHLRSRGHVIDGNNVEAAMNRVRVLIMKPVIQHEAVLLAKCRTTRFKDAYGKWVEQGWDREVEYFYEHVAQEEINDALGSTGVEVLDHRLRELLADQPLSSVHTGFGTAPDSLCAVLSCIIIKSYIETLGEEASDLLLAGLEDGGLTPGQYERYCAQLLEEAGWTTVVLGGAGDQGVDLLAELNGRKLVVQCKYYSQPVGNGAVQEAHAGKAVYLADFAFVVSNCDYTPGARIAALRTGVVLAHHDQLIELARELGTG
jgi:restriction system protein